METWRRGSSILAKHCATRSAGRRGPGLICFFGIPYLVGVCDNRISTVVRSLVCIYSRVGFQNEEFPIFLLMVTASNPTEPGNPFLSAGKFFPAIGGRECRRQGLGNAKIVFADKFTRSGKKSACFIRVPAGVPIRPNGKTQGRVIEWVSFIHGICFSFKNVLYFILSIKHN
ncbi:MAG: hypothetical protein ABFS02_03065 [Pseudomonadota bacterium]